MGRGQLLMTLDKVVDSAALDAGMSLVADAIRAKAGTTDPLAWPDGFKAAVEGIQAGEDNTVLDALISGSIDGYYSNDRVTSIGSYSFAYKYVNSVSFNSVIFIGDNAFKNCPVLSSVSFNLAEYIGDSAFGGCESIASASFPNARQIGAETFGMCSSLEKISFPKAESIGEGTFAFCQSLIALILGRSDGLCNLASPSALTGTPIESGTGYIYVPAALVDQYKAATNWTTYANQIRAIEDYPDICGGTA